MIICMKGLGLFFCGIICRWSVFLLSDHPSDSQMAECGARMNSECVDVCKGISYLSQ